jgi:hypothetical protein
VSALDAVLTAFFATRDDDIPLLLILAAAIKAEMRRATSRWN